jgi:hypothetical protein
LGETNVMSEIKYPCILDEDGMKDEDEGIYIDRYDTAEYLIDVMNKSGNDAEKMSDEISKFVDYLLR